MIRRFIAFYRPYKALFALDIVTAVLHSGFTLCVPLLIRNMLKYDLPAGDLAHIWLTLGVLLVLVALMSITRYINTRWGHVLGTRIETDMRRDLFGHLQKLSFSYFDSAKTGHIISRIANDLFSISELAHHGPEDFLISLCLVAGAIAMMFWFNVSLALVALVPLLFMLTWGMIYGRRMKVGFRRVRQKIADINSSVEDSIQGIREVKSYTNEEREIDKFGEVNLKFRSAKERMYGVMAGFHSGMTFLMESCMLVVVGGGAVLACYGKVDLADVIGFLLYVRFMMNPVRRLVNFVEQFQQGAASFERFVEIMDVEPDIVDRPNAVCPGRIEGDVVFDGVWFRYATSADWVLQDIDLRAPAGATIALVGESGAGKSTLASLVPRFYEAQKGAITIDGRDVLDHQQRSLRENIGIVQQNVFLFDSTIRENIMFGNPAAAEEDLIRAAESANIMDFIGGLPDGFDTWVGEHGVKLSGGQKQRVSIARAFLKNPPILIFDEATSSLDGESERLIRASMEALCRSRTTIVIAHRLITVQNADCIFVLRRGRIIEEGVHAELLQRGGGYSELYAGSSF